MSGQRYFKAKNDLMFIPENNVYRLFKSKNNKAWYVTLPDWTNVQIESPLPLEIQHQADVVNDAYK